jgi:outer membrane lipoprotein-sorting protein
MVMALVGGFWSEAPGQTPAPGSMDSEERGLMIAREADRRTADYEDFIASLRMILVGRDGRQRIRELEFSALAIEGDGERTLLLFRSPRDLTGTAFLSHAHDDGGEDQWMYLPAVKRTRRIAGASRSSSFMGSEFAYEDVSSGRLERYRHRYVGIESLDGKDAQVVDRVPVDEQSGYSRQRVWFESSRSLPVRIEYFDLAGEPLKTLTLENYARHGELWRAGTMRMKNLRTGAETRLEWSDFRFDTGLSARQFTPDDLDRRGA